MAVRLPRTALRWCSHPTRSAYDPLICRHPARLVRYDIALARPWHGSRTGAGLVKDYLGYPELRDGPQDANALFHEGARSYLDGVKDITEGVAWCYDGYIKPHELNQELIESLQRLPAAELKGKDAPLVLAYLHRTHPCPVLAAYQCASAKIR